jgi:HAD superfamily hydrolase (TIGR01509 family)
VSRPRDASVQALVFDFDGLILDTETSSYETARDVWAAHGADLAIARWQDRIGTHRRPWIDDLEDLVGPIPDREGVLERRIAAHHERLLAEAAMPGVHELVVQAAASGLGMAIASSSPQSWVTEHLARLELLEHFTVLSCWEEGLRPKPAPDVYLRALDRLGVAATEAVAFEDSPNGIAAAKAAGLRCIAVPNQMTASLDLSAADHVAASFLDLDLRRINMVGTRAARSSPTRRRGPSGPGAA